jgi:adenosylmethionine-8-amino-7-oxononanoate aminotransferase
MRRALEDAAGQVCAVVIEPLVQAAGGLLTHDVTFVRGVRELCNEFGALMVVDEVATGIGRTGRMWAVDHAGVTPDLLTCGKGLTGGYLPLSAVLAREEVYAAFLGAPAQARTFFHGHSYTANPLCCAAAIANLDLMAERDTVGHAARVGDRIGELTKGLETYDGVREVRRVGTMTGIEVASVGERTGFAVCQEARRRGVWVRPLGDVVVLMPPLAIGDDDLETLGGVVDDSIRAVVR